MFIIFSIYIILQNSFCWKHAFNNNHSGVIAMEIVQGNKKRITLKNMF